VTGGVALLGAVIALLFLPARAADEERMASVIGDGGGDRREVDTDEAEVVAASGG
jgi:hypothetical protein